MLAHVVNRVAGICSTAPTEELSNTDNSETLQPAQDSPEPAVFEFGRYSCNKLPNTCETVLSKYVACVYMLQLKKNLQAETMLLPALPRPLLLMGLYDFAGQPGMVL